MVDVTALGVSNFWDAILAGDDTIRLGGRLQAWTFGSAGVTAFGDFRQNAGGATVCGRDSIVIETGARSTNFSASVRVTGDVENAVFGGGGVICGDDVISAGMANFGVTLYGDLVSIFGFANDAFIRFGDDILVGGEGDDALYGDAGPGLAMTLSGGDDRIFGGIGNDTLVGGAGDDLLFGENGDDRLEAGAGTDRLEGGQGNDIYIVDRFDLVIEAASGGNDTVVSAGTRTIDAEVETLTLSGGAANAFGDGRDNVLNGSLGANAIYGLERNPT